MSQTPAPSLSRGVINYAFPQPVRDASPLTETLYQYSINLVPGTPGAYLTPERPSCFVRVIKTLFWERIFRTVCIAGIVLGVLTLTVALLYHYGLLQKGLQMLPFLNVTLGPAITNLSIPGMVGGAIFTAAAGVGFVIDLIYH